MAKKLSWHSISNELVRCPIPDCGHIGKIITKAHCKLEHNMTRDEVCEKYGMPKRLITKSLFQVQMGGNNARTL